MGYSKLRDTPPIKKVNSGSNTIIPRDIINARSIGLQRFTM